MNQDELAAQWAAALEAQAEPETADKVEPEAAAKEGSKAVEETPPAAAPEVASPPSPPKAPEPVASPVPPPPAPPAAEVPRRPAATGAGSSAVSADDILKRTGRSTSRDMSVSAVLHLMGIPTSSDLGVLEKKIDILTSRFVSLSSKLDRVSAQWAQGSYEAYLDRIDYQIADLRMLLKRLLPKVLGEEEEVDRELFADVAPSPAEDEEVGEHQITLTSGPDEGEEPAEVSKEAIDNRKPKGDDK